MKLRYIGLAEFEPRLPQDKQRVVNGDIVGSRICALCGNLSGRPAGKRPLRSGQSGYARFHLKS